MISSGLRVSSQPPHFARKACVGFATGVSVHPSASAARKATNSCATASKRRNASSRVIITTPSLARHSCGLTRVVFQEPAEPLTALHRAWSAMRVLGRRKEQDIPLPLMIALMMIMRRILAECMLQGCFTKQDEPCKALLLDGSHPALRVGVQIRRPRWQWYPFHPSCINNLLKGGAV